CCWQVVNVLRPRLAQGVLSMQLAVQSKPGPTVLQLTPSVEQVRPVHMWTWAHAMSQGVVPVVVVVVPVVVLPEVVVTLVVVTVMVVPDDVAVVLVPPVPPVPVVLPVLPVTVEPPQPANHETVALIDTTIPQA